MSLRPPKDLAKIVNPQSGMSMVEAEMLAESAASLGHHGRKTEAALKALSLANDNDRSELTRRAGREVWAYFIQREMMGMRDHRLIIREMGIPQEVLNCLGAIEPSA